MFHLGNLQKIQLSQIIQKIETHEKTGLLTISQDEQKASLHFLRGRLMGISLLHENIPLELGIMGSGQFNAGARQEAIEIVQNLLTWSVGEVYFDEGVQPESNRFPLALRITSLIPSLLIAHSTPILPMSAPELLIEEAPTLIPAPSPPSQSKIPEEKLMVEKASVPRTPHPFLSNESRPATHKTPLQEVPTTPLPIIKEPFSPAIHLLQTLKSSVASPRSAGGILPLPDYDLTTRLLTPRGRHNAIQRWEVPLIALILLIVALTQAINMFHFPYYEQDEGTYMSQAWALVHMGRLAYYTYFYDHSPLGWIQIAAWTISTGGFHTFGSAIDSGRVLMLLFQEGSTLILYCIARSLSSKVSIAVCVSLLFTLSPYGIYFHRIVLLDNIATFWMLVSIVFLVSDRLTLKQTWLSAVALSISILSKEVTFFLVPVLAYLVFFRADKSHRWFAVIGWIALVVSIISLYPLMAILNNELFPSGTLLGGTTPHVSLLETLQANTARGRDGGFFSLSSAFWQQTKIWAKDDPILVVAGSLSAILSILMIKKHRLVGITGLLTLSLWVFLARGGVIIGYYLVPLLPLLALNVGLVIGLVAESVKKLLAVFVSMKSIGSRIIEQAVIILCVIGIVIGCLGPSVRAGYGSPDLGNKNDPLIFWSSAQADAQNQATQWIEKNLSPGSHMIIDESMWTDLYDHGYRFADYYWKVQADPAIRDKVYHNNWRNFDYIITTPELLTDAQNNKMTFVEQVMAHSTRIAYFDTGGWRLEIRKVNK